MRTFAYLACGVSDPEDGEGPAACAGKRSPEPPAVSELASKEEGPTPGFVACLGISLLFVFRAISVKLS